MKPKILSVMLSIFTMLSLFTPAHATTHFTPVWSTVNPFNPMNFILISAEGLAVEAGDEIGIFDGNICVGAGVVAGNISIQNSLTIIASQDDGTGNGFTEGDTVSFQLWNAGTGNLVTNISPTFMDMTGNLVSPTPTFKGNEDYSVKLSLNSGIPVLSVTPASVNVSDAGGTGSFNVSNTGGGTMTWTSTSNAVWLKIVDGKTGTDNGTIKVNYTENTGIQRTGTITVTAEGATGSPKTVKVIQGLPSVIMKVGKGAGKTTAPVSVNITAEGEDIDLSIISGAVFTLEYSSDLLLESVESDFFDTFQAQIQEANPPNAPTVPADYDRPLLYSTNDTSATTKTMVSAARGVSTSDSQAAGNVLFTLKFRLNDEITEGTYPISIVPSSLNSPNAGYDSEGEEVDLLVGYEDDAFQKLIRADNYEQQVEKGSLAFGNCIITPSAGKGGTITPADMLVADCGSDNKFIIKANTCYHIKDILVDGNSLGNDVAGKTEVSYNIIASENHTISAEFEADIYLLTVKADTGGTISYLDASGNPLAIPESGIITVNCGSDMTLIITPAKCYHISKILRDNVAVPTDQYEIIEDNKISYTIKNITADIMVQTQFTGVDKVTITATADPETLGSIEPSGKIELACGGSQTFTISPKDTTCNYVKDVLADGISKGDIKTFSFNEIVSDHTIIAKFAEATYNVKVTADAGGTIDPAGDADGNVPVGCKSSPVFEIIPDECHTIKSVKVDGVFFGAISEYTFPYVTKDHTLEASFNTKSITIITSAGQGGNILTDGNIVSGPVTIDCGGDKIFYIKPDTGYHVADVTVDGQSKGMITSYTFTKIVENHTIEVKFETNLPGDIDGNKKVELADAVLGLKILAGIQSAANIQIGADVNADGKISIAEVIYVLRKVVGL